METPKKNVIPRVAAYLRVSTEEQKIKGLSVEAQQNAIEQWAKEYGAQIIGFYNDAGISARKKYNKRPELLRLMSDVESGKIDLIVFTKLDRWFRNIGEYYKVQEILETHGVNWKAIHEDYETLTSSGRLKINIMLSVAQDEADRDGERIRAVFDHKRENKEPVTGCVPTGYLVRNKKMVKDPEWEASISSFFDAYMQTRSISKARTLVADQHSKIISYELACAFLRKTAYYGRFNQVDDICPAYISKEQYDLIQSTRKRFERKTKSNRIYLFTGLLYCGACGNRYQSGSPSYIRKNGDRIENPAYNCHSTYARSTCTNRVNIRECYLEEYLLNNVEACFEKYNTDYAAEVTASNRDYAKEIERLKRKLIKLKDLYVNDLIDIEAYRVDYEKFNSELAELVDKKAPKQPDLDRLKSVFCAGWQEAYKKSSRESKQAFWRNLLSRVVINSDRSINIQIFP